MQLDTTAAGDTETVNASNNGGGDGGNGGWKGGID